MQRNITEIYENIAQPAKFNWATDQNRNQRRIKRLVDDSGDSEYVPNLEKLKDTD